MAMRCFWNRSGAGEWRAAVSQMKCVLIGFVLFWQVTEGQEAIKGTLHLGNAAAIEDGHRGRTVTRGTVKAK